MFYGKLLTSTCEEFFQLPLIKSQTKKIAIYLVRARTLINFKGFRSATCGEESEVTSVVIIIGVDEMYSKKYSTGLLVLKKPFEISLLKQPQKVIEIFIFIILIAVDTTMSTTQCCTKKTEKTLFSSVVEAVVSRLS